MKKTRQLLFSICLLAISATSAAGFDINGQAIRPSCIAIFNVGTKSIPFVTSIDLTECQKNAATNKATHRGENGELYFYLNDNTAKKSTYSYRVIGKTDNGLYIIHTLQSNKQQHNDMLLFIELSQQQMPIFARGKLKQNKPANTAILRGFVAGGNGCSGGIKTAKVHGNRVMIQQYAYMNSVEQCQGEKSYSIDTSTWQKSTEYNINHTHQ